MRTYTTIEQSKKILSLGILADTADCYYKRHLLKPDEYFEGPIVLPEGQTISSWCGTENGVDENLYVPCWSVGQLIDIYLISQNTNGFYTDKESDYVDLIIEFIEQSIAANEWHNV